MGARATRQAQSHRRAMRKRHGPVAAFAKAKLKRPTLPCPMQDAPVDRAHLCWIPRDRGQRGLGQAAAEWVGKRAGSASTDQGHAESDACRLGPASAQATFAVRAYAAREHSAAPAC